MMRKSITALLLLGWMLGAAGPAAASSVDGTIDATAKYAWSENVGWINFGTSEGNVHVTDTGLTGYAWGENVGWISMNCSNGNSCGTVDYKVSNDGAGTLSGYAWSENTGWISFNPTGGGVTIGSTGAFSGYAWGENIGWIVFNCATTNSCGTVDYRVQTDWLPSSVRAGSGSTGSGGTVLPPGPLVAILRPEPVRSYLAGQSTEIAWLASNAAFDSFRIEYSVDGGSRWELASEVASGTQRTVSWTPPNVSTNSAYLRVYGYGVGRTLLASDMIDGPFRLSGGASTVPVSQPFTTDPTATGVYDRLLAELFTPDINVDKGLSDPRPHPACGGASLVKGSMPAVYFCGNDGKRYAFPNEKIYFTWFADFGSVVQIPNIDLATIPLGGNVTYRPGKRLLKITTNPKVYAVSRGGLLRWVPSETVANAFFGSDWNRQIDDVSDAFFVNYRIGDPIASP